VQPGGRFDVEAGRVFGERERDPAAARPSTWRGPLRRDGPRGI